MRLTQLYWCVFYIFYSFNHLDLCLKSVDYCLIVLSSCFKVGIHIKRSTRRRKRNYITRSRIVMRKLYSLFHAARTKYFNIIRVVIGCFGYCLFYFVGCQTHEYQNLYILVYRLSQRLKGYFLVISSGDYYYLSAKGLKTCDNSCGAGCNRVVIILNAVKLPDKLDSMLNAAEIPCDLAYRIHRNSPHTADIAAR